MRYTAGTLGAIAFSIGMWGIPDEAKAQNNIEERLGVSVTHCTDVETAPVDELIGLRVHYETDRCQINGDHLETIEAAIAQAQALNPGQPVHAFVIGETDPRAPYGYNQRLGMQRASGLARALEARGVTVQRILSIGESRAPQEIRNNPTARNAFAYLGTAEQIAACASVDTCVANKVVNSGLRPR